MILKEEDTFATDFDVSADFDFVVHSLCLQAVLMCVFCFYQLAGIYLFNGLLTYRFLVSRCNKMTLAFGMFVFFSMHYYRFNEPGRICSGDYLSLEEWQDDNVNKNFLIYQGQLFQTYVRVVWIGIFLSILMVIAITK